MKNLVTALVLAGMAISAPAFALCINTRDIVSSKSDDGKLLVFKMRDGRTLVNHLHGVCNDLRFNGYVWVLRSGDNQVCENQQSLQVLQSGQVCVLGKFDPPKISRGTN